MSNLDVYYEKVKETLDRAFAQRDALEKAAGAIAGTWADGKMVYTFGTGHAHLLSLEGFYRAGGPVRLYPVLEEDLMLHVSASKSSGVERQEGLAGKILEKYPAAAWDTIIIFSNSGRNAVPVEMAAEAKKRGMTVIAMTNLTHSSACTPRNSLHLRLFETADIVLDNGGVMGDAAVMEQDGRMIAPTSTAVGAALLQAVLARADELLMQSGKTPETYASSNIDGGDQINQQLIDRYKGVISCL